MGEFHKAVAWVLSKFWDWSLVAVGAPVIYGLGLAALFGDEYIIASATFFAAIAWVTAKALTWEETRGHDSRRAVILLMGIVGFVGSLAWVRHKQKASVAPKLTFSREVKTPPTSTNVASPIRAPETSHPLQRVPDRSTPRDKPVENRDSPTPTSNSHLSPRSHIRVVRIKFPPLNYVIHAGDKVSVDIDFVNSGDVATAHFFYMTAASIVYVGSKPSDEEQLQGEDKLFATMSQVQESNLGVY